jgi:hypothetical protein
MARLPPRRTAASRTTLAATTAAEAMTRPPRTTRLTRGWAPRAASGTASVQGRASSTRPPPTAGAAELHARGARRYAQEPRARIRAFRGVRRSPPRCAPGVASMRPATQTTAAVAATRARPGSPMRRPFASTAHAHLRAATATCRAAGPASNSRAAPTAGAAAMRAVGALRYARVRAPRMGARRDALLQRRRSAAGRASTRWAMRTTVEHAATSARRASPTAPRHAWGARALSHATAVTRPATAPVSTSRAIATTAAAVGAHTHAAARPPCAAPRYASRPVRLPRRRSAAAHASTRRAT